MPVTRITDPEVLATGGGRVDTGVVEEVAYLITDFAGLDILLKLGVTVDGNRVMRQWMRETGSEVWYSTIEMLLEFDNYFRDTNTGLIPGSGKDVPPTPL